MFSMGTIAVLFIVGYFFKDIIKFVVILGFIAFIAIYKFETIGIIFNGVVQLIENIQGVI